ncbi:MULTISPECIES: hypothetical protein [Acetobacter]|jgi:hypothetical protein|uniref:Uncharacterized protein n=1 Tax=Acetobacter lovaniensis TaxID=104100 RepID=A0A841QFA7_9PROT|nr:hypothetical protein [Acetobacter lovaniensis]MBB6457160.1 hypothetical protein [Acetobacter lovaniensis]MCI1697740.1 hypothetical protein [Acetobacter lovaniensis]MCI1795091.1 hypothetical protein [Acetobacter lovaniensis]MCP1239498.1 hypothetical protein [Acetobacter lovaniensis]NHN81258.1 hypothetical protein [Acetobacter lovaniensis]
MTDTPQDLQSRLLQAFGAVSALLEQENALLKTGRWQDVETLLPRKRTVLETLRKLLPLEQTRPLTAEQRSAGVSTELEAAARQFNMLVRANEDLLQSAIAAQGTLIQLVLDDAAQEQRTGYGASGGYTVDSHAGALALRSDV